jgi:hypothetical protein
MAEWIDSLSCVRMCGRDALGDHSFWLDLFQSLRFRPVQAPSHPKIAIIFVDIYESVCCNWHLAFVNILRSLSLQNGWRTDLGQVYGSRRLNIPPRSHIYVGQSVSRFSLHRLHIIFGQVTQALPSLGILFEEVLGLFVENEVLAAEFLIGALVFKFIETHFILYDFDSINQVTCIVNSRSCVGRRPWGESSLLLIFGHDGGAALG